MKAPLYNINVVEVATVLAGPAVGMFLAELGATVTKYEPSDGDVTRSWTLPDERATDQPGSYYASVNWGKSLRILSTKIAEDLDGLRRAIDAADIALFSMRRSKLVELGLDERSCRERNQALIYCRIVGFDDDDDRPAYDAVLQAETGYMYLNREPNALPQKMPVALIDVLAAHQAKEAVLLGLLQRSTTGVGSSWTVSLRDAALAALSNQGAAALFAGINPEPLGSAHPTIVPYGKVFKTADSYIVLAVGSDHQFGLLMAELGIDEAQWSPQYSTNANRVLHAHQVYTLLEVALKGRSGRALHERCNTLGVPCGLIQSPSEAIEQADKGHLYFTDGTGHRRGLRSFIAKSDSFMPRALSVPSRLNVYTASESTTLPESTNETVL